MDKFGGAVTAAEFYSPNDITEDKPASSRLRDSVVSNAIRSKEFLMLANDSKDVHGKEFLAMVAQS